MNLIYNKIKENKTKLLKSNFTKSVLYIAGGTAITQIINVFFSPILTRLYLPSEYGIMAIFSSIIMLFSFSSLKYELAIPIPENDKSAINLAGVSFCILSIFTLVLTGVLYFYGDRFLSLLDADSMSQYKYFLSVGVFFIGVYQILLKWNYRRKSFKLISKTKVGQNLSGNIVKTVAGYFGFGVFGLLFGKIISESVSIVVFLKKFYESEKNIFHHINFKEMVYSFKRYKDFAIYQTPGTFLSRFKNQLPIFNMSLYGASTVGMYGLANTIVKLPMTVIGHSIRNVFFAEAASIGKKNPIKLKNLSNSLMRKLILIGIFPTLALIIIGPWLFSFAFGEQWYEAGVYARILSVAIYSDFIFSPVSRVFEVIEKQKQKMILDLLGLGLVLLSFGSAKYFFNGSAYVAIIFYSSSMSIFYFATYVLARFYINKEIELVKKEK
ncbi:UNVERIFIED_CONTAM: O-antigen/teichoic acid export membrane protein [Acetivibrio alkalicellulosi]